MRTVIAVFILALVFAPIASVYPQTWPGSYAHWQLPETPAEAWLLASTTEPPPQKPSPDDSWWCLGYPRGWPGCPNTGVAAW